MLKETEDTTNLVFPAKYGVALLKGVIKLNNFKNLNLILQTASKRLLSFFLKWYGNTHSRYKLKYELQ